MKKYQQKRNLKGELKAANLLPIWPTFESGDPQVNEVVYRWFTNDGNYLGWTKAEDGKKFLLGKLYYKTKGAYRIQTKKSFSDRTTKKIFIYEKNSSFLAAYAVLRSIRTNDLIDLDDREALCKASIQALNNFSFTPWNYTDYPNPYKLIPESMKAKLREDMANFIASKKQELINYVTDDLNAHVAQRQNVHIHGVNLVDL